MFRTNWQAYEAGHPAVHNQIARRLNAVVNAADYATLQDAVHAATHQTAAGGVVFLPPGVYTLDSPLILPRTGATPDGTVHLSGAGRYLTIIRGSAAFPPNRALIEWERAAVRTWEQRIAHLTLALPQVVGVKAIAYQVTDRTSWAAVDRERASISLEDIYITAHNDYHPVLIDLQGINACARIADIQADPVLGDGTYDTLLLKTDSDFNSTPPGGADAPGLFQCVVSGLSSMMRVGGLSRLFDGRIHRTTFQNAICDGGRNGPDFAFRNSLNSVLDNLSTEGRGGKPQYLFTNCQLLSGRQIGIGSPNAVGASGVGNGIDFVKCRDLHFEGRFAEAGNPAFSASGVKVVHLDADCQRVQLERWYVKGTAANEVQNDAPEMNSVQVVSV